MTHLKSFNDDNVKTLKEKLRLYTKQGKIEPLDAQTVLRVFTITSFQQFLEAENFDHAEQLIVAIINATDEKTTLTHFEELRKVCMGVWLEQCSGFAINNNGDLEVNIDKTGVTFSDKFNAHLTNQTKSIIPTFYRQATFRQIERYFVMKANGLFDQDFKPKTIADIGAGSLIGAAMMRDTYPEATITAYEPGLIREKTLKIAQKKNITLINESLESYQPDQKFDLILLHFVLEHDRKQAQSLIKEALKRLSKNGKISIAVPNFEAWHREFETVQNMNKRDPITRLSTHDIMSGHQIIFSVEELMQIITEAQKEQGYHFATQAQTILPRPLSFIKIMAQTPDNQILYDLEQQGHPKGKSHQGSVIAATIGHSSLYRTPESTEDLPALFQSLIP